MQKNFPQFVKILKEKCSDIELDYDDNTAYVILYRPNGNRTTHTNDDKWIVGYVFEDGCLSLDDGVHFYPTCIDDYARFANAVKIAIDEEENREEIYEK